MKGSTTLVLSKKGTDWPFEEISFFFCFLNLKFIYTRADILRTWSLVGASLSCYLFKFSVGRIYGREEKVRGANVKSIKTTRHTGAFLVPCVLPEPRQNILTIFQVDKMNGGKKNIWINFFKKAKSTLICLIIRDAQLFHWFGDVDRKRVTSVGIFS